MHIHTDHPEQVFCYLRTLGQLVTHKAEDMQVQHATVERAAAGARAAGAPARQPGDGQRL